MNSHHDYNDYEFEKAFKIGGFPPALFTHEAHIRLAFIHLRKYGLSIAGDNMCSQIMSFAKAAGDAGKFNKTLTIAAVKIVNHFLRKSNANKFDELTLEYPVLLADFKKLLFAHYGPDVINSEAARKHFIAPDILPFVE